MGAVFTAPGPIDHYVRLRNGTTLYLGTAKVSPQQQLLNAFLNVPNDLRGRSYPGVRVYDGQIAMVTTVMNRVDLAALRILRDQSRAGGLTSPGIQASPLPGSVSTGVNDFQLILVNSYFGVAGQNPDLAAGRIYFSVELEDDGNDAAGERVFDDALTFRCDAILTNPVTRTWALYSESPTDIGTLPAVN